MMRRRICSGLKYPSILKVIMESYYGKMYSFGKLNVPMEKVFVLKTESLIENVSL